MMGKLVPITKIILTVGSAFWALVLHRPDSLAVLMCVELLILIAAGLLFQNIKTVLTLGVFAVMLGVVEYLGGGTLEMCEVAALRMMNMTLLFIYLLGTTRLQDLTATMVRQMHVPYEYAFMFTAGLRFVPDFLEENRAVAEAQACRGLALEGNFFKKVHRYMSIVRPLMLRSLGRSETMALSLELRGFGSKNRTFLDSVSPKAADYLFMAVAAGVTVFVIYGRLVMGL